MKRFGLPLLMVAAWCGLHAEARGEPLVADLSSHVVEITAGFTGTEVLLFGSVDEPGQIVVEVKGPPQEFVVRRKERVAGIWVNVEEVSFPQAPAFYQLLSTEPLGEWLPLRTRQVHQIGVEYLDLRAKETVGAATSSNFRNALIRNKQRRGHYGELLGNVTMLGERLFRADVYFPANVPPGVYEIALLLIRDGEVKSAQSTPLYVSKGGIGAKVFELAHESPALYGLLAIVIAVVAGLAGNALFRRH